VGCRFFRITTTARIRMNIEATPQDTRTASRVDGVDLQALAGHLPTPFSAPCTAWTR
jgi:hypothetical protein